ncbi:cytochrome P450 4e3-like [Condylostylus longicornis]|uniref:cytochrome P450 4e3-like n=1 Tax=Condylostylus longicornis TaxID=2530218 RepID=UPI00244E2FA5|nr:cytochrome P450 4e3-like [Condylostylus longicornis]
MLFYLLLIVLLALYCFYNYNIRWKYIDKIQGPTALPIIGNIHQIGFNPIGKQFKVLYKYLKFFMKLSIKYKQETFRIWIGSKPFIIVTDPKDMEVILSSNTLFKKATMYRLLFPWLGDGLLTIHGDKWFKHRKMITPSFHFDILVDFHDIMKEKSKIFVKHLKLKANKKEIFDIQEKLEYITLDIICETAMGQPINSIENNKLEVVRAFQDLHHIVQNPRFGLFISNPILFQIYKEYVIRTKALNIVKKFSMDASRSLMIERRRNLIICKERNENFNSDSDKNKRVFLDTLLTSTIDGKPLTNQEIYDEVQTFIFEGRDTISSGITFAIYLLSRHPNIQEKVYQEQKLIFGDDLKNCNPSYHNVQNMKYLDMVIKECQRLYPSGPLIARETTKLTDLNGKTIPKNTTLALFIFAMGYNEKYFPDPYKFDPERFSSDRDKINPFEYIPFSAGPRNCIGQKFAMLEMKSIVSDIVRNFKILPPNDECLKINGDYEYLGRFEYDPVLALLLTLRAERGLKIILENR